MKDSLLINSGLFLEFWAEVIDTANYFRNRLPTRSQKSKLIPEKAQTKKKQNISHVKVFGSTVSILILHEKRYKSDINNNWKRIFIGYSQDTLKHVRVWAPKTQQILLVSNLYVDKLEQGARLLINHPLDLTHHIATMATKRKGPTSELRPRNRPCKAQVIETTSSTSSKAGDAVVETKPLLIDVSGSEKGDVANEKVISAIEVSNKIYELTSQKKVIADLIHSK